MLDARDHFPPSLRPCRWDYPPPQQQALKPHLLLAYKSRACQDREATGFSTSPHPRLSPHRDLMTGPWGGHRLLPPTR